MDVSGTYYNPYQGFFTHSGASGRLRSHILALFWPFLTPPANPVQFLYIYKKKFLNRTKRLKLISNHSMDVSGTYYNPFQGFLTHTGASGGLRSHILAKKWPFLTPPANPVQFFWLKMPSKCVPWIVLQVLTSTCTSRRSLRPPKRPSKAKNGQNITFLAISGSVLSDFAIFPASPLKYEKNAAFGSHVALSVLQIDWLNRGKSTYQSTTKNSPKPIPLPSPLFFSFFWSILGLKSFNGRQWVS